MRESQIERIARDAHPDLIVVTGDLVAKGASRSRRLARYGVMGVWLARLPAPDGVWFVQGHGEKRPLMPEEELAQVLTRTGVRVLLDAVTPIRRGGATLWLGGVRLRDETTEGTWEVDASGRVRLQPGPSHHALELAGEGWDSASRQELTGRLRFSSQEDTIGILLHSRLGHGEDRRYVVQRHPASPRVTASARGTVFTRGHRADEGAREPPAAGVWHRFRVSAEPEAEGIVVRGRWWPETEPEPAEWDVDYLDGSPDRILAGPPGLYGKGPGIKEFDDLGWSPARNVYWREPRGSDFVSSLIARTGGEGPLVLMAHSPDLFADAASAGAPLLLAGHTQGGQVRLPFFGALVTSTRLGRAFDRGLFSRGGTQMYINGGVGTTRLPLRFLSPPEAAVLTLRSAAQGPR